METTDLNISHGTLVDALELAIEFNNDEAVVKGEYLQGQFEDFRRTVETTPGYRGVFGTGYPFYALKADGGVYAVNEISRFTQEYVPKVKADELRLLGKWPCASCQVERGLPDLKTFCRPCDIVTYKPRDLFKVLPDVDFWVVIDTPDTTHEKQIEESLEDAGFYTSDKSIKSALDTTIHVMQDIKAGQLPGERLPIDLHVVGKEQLMDAMDRVPDELAKTDGSPYIPISPRSLHVAWEEPDEPYDFLKDFLFSMTPKGWHDNELLDSLEQNRRTAKRLLGASVVDFVARLAPKEARQLQSTPAVREALEERVAGW